MTEPVKYISVSFVVKGNVESYPILVADFEPPEYSIRNEIVEDVSIRVWLPGSEPPPLE